MKLGLRLLGGAGMVVFGLFLMLTYVSPIHVERAARNFIQGQIQRQLEAELGIARGTAARMPADRMARTLAERREREMGALRERLATGLNAEIAAVMAGMQEADCECRRRVLAHLDAATERRLSTLGRAGPQLRRIVEGKYGQIAGVLLRDLRIFAGTNLLAFLPLLGLSIARPAHIGQLFLPGMLLGAAALTTSAFYLFGQDWFFTLLYADYVGWTYGIWLLLVFALYGDIVLFRARLTTRIIDVIGSAIGKALVPC